jgi:hypothetical protein
MNAFTKRLNQYGTDVNTHDAIKFLAIIIMTIDHLGAYLYPDFLWFRAIGRITFPVWFFLVGYSKSQKIDAYFIGLACVIQIFNVISFYPLFPLNALFSIIVCRIFVRALMNKSVDFVVNIGLVCFFVGLLPVGVYTGTVFEYGIIAIQYALMGRIVRLRNEGEKLNVMAWVYYGLICVYFVFVQNVSFKFVDTQAIFVAFGTALVVLYLAFYTLHPMEWLSALGVFSGALKYISRYSLEYYLLHRVILQVSSVWLNEAHEHVYKWVD